MSEMQIKGGVRPMKKPPIKAVFPVHPAFRQGVARKPLYDYIAIDKTGCQIRVLRTFAMCWQ
jgi:hypothetical protein